MAPRRLLVFMGMAVLLAAGCRSGRHTVGGGGSAQGGGSPPNAGSTGGPPLPSASLPYHPVIDPSRFSATVDNPWFPLKPGTVFTYEGVKDGKPSRDVYTVTNETKAIDGVPCVVVHDSLYLSGTLEEETFDYYSQDAQGNVWYFGEDTEELDPNGKVTSTEGTWHSGVDGAEPGIFMEANPVVGHSFRQEYYKGQAEDEYRVADLSASVSVPYGSYNDAMLTEEWTALEPDVLDHKFYVRGVGEVAELSVKGPTEEARLVSVTTG
jgi:hypothetical protein